MIDADTLTAAILAAGYSTEEIARIADALGASYHAIATPGATPADEARGLVVRSAMINSATWRP